MAEDDIYQQWLTTIDRFEHEHYVSTGTVGNLTEAETRLVMIIYRAQEQMTAIRPGVLAELSCRTPSALSQLLGSLTKKGVIERKHRSEDFRAVYVVLTSKGTEFAQMADTALVDATKELIDYLGEEDAREVIRILDKVNQYHESLAAEGRTKKVTRSAGLRDMLDA